MKKLILASTLAISVTSALAGLSPHRVKTEPSTYDYVNCGFLLNHTARLLLENPLTLKDREITEEVRNKGMKLIRYALRTSSEKQVRDYLEIAESVYDTPGLSPERYHAELEVCAKMADKIKE